VADLEEERLLFPSKKIFRFFSSENEFILPQMDLKKWFLPIIIPPFAMFAHL
jgi:hypothetical protein